MEKQKNAMEVFKSEFNIKKEILEKTMKQMNAIKQRNGLGNEGGNIEIIEVDWHKQEQKMKIK